MFAESDDELSIKSFTLVELLVIIAVLSVLSVGVVLVLKPQNIIAQARDSKRLSDLQKINKALSLLEADNYNTYFGDPNTVYVSLIDPVSTSCASFLSELSPLPSGYQYHCSTSTDIAQKVDGIGWIPVDFTKFSSGIPPLVKLPLDPKNSAADSFYYTYLVGGSWKLQAALESSKYLTSQAANDGGILPTVYEVGSDLNLGSDILPSYWVKVPGDPLFGTSDFYVMQYEAKYDKDGDGKGDDAGSCYHTFGHDTWDWGKTGTDCPSSWSFSRVISSPYGSPIAGITHNEAKTICQALGGHLITNEEWMTIARNIEQVAANWSGGAVGSGCIFMGNNGVNDACGYDGGNPEKGINRNVKAKLILSNGSEIWDFPGNTWEHVMRDINDKSTPMDLPPCSDNVAAWGYCQYGNSLTPYISSWTSDIPRDSFGPSNSTWNSNQGVGQVFTYKAGGNQGTQFILRGGNWYIGSNGGIFAAYLLWNSLNQLGNVGFRCVRY